MTTKSKKVGYCLVLIIKTFRVKENCLQELNYNQL